MRVEDRVGLEVEGLDAVVESLTRLSDIKQRHPALELLMHNVPFGVLLLDADLRLLGANRAYKEFFDAAIEFSLGTPVHELLPNADECGIAPILRRALDKGRAVRVKNFRYDGFSKGVTYWSGSAIPVRLSSGDGPHDAVAMVALEVTDEVLAREQLANFAVLAERRAAETELERSKLNAVIEAVPVPLLVFDANRTVTAFNSAAQQLFGSAGLPDWLGASPTVGSLPPTVRLRDAEDRAIPVDRLPVPRSLKGETCRNEVLDVCCLQQGMRITLRVDSAPLTDANGDIMGVVAALSDITQEMRAQEQIQESYEREHAIAVKLQETFLAFDLPQMDGFEYEQAYHPAKDASMVGGDFCDIFRVGKDEFAIVMADVAGKGLKSAVYTAMTKYILRAYALEESDPCKVLARLNDALSACTPSEVFVTLAYGTLDTSKRVFTYSNAGHEHPLLRSACKGDVCMLEVTGRALALMEGSEYTTQSVELAAGDVVVLYTDGITDAGSGADRLGQDRLMDLLRSHADVPLVDLVNVIVREAQQFAGGVLADDAALLAIRAL